MNALSKRGAGVVSSREERNARAESGILGDINCERANSIISFREYYIHYILPLQEELEYQVTKIGR